MGTFMLELTMWFFHPLYQSDTVSQVVLQNDSTTVLILIYTLTFNLNIETKNIITK